MRRAIVVVLSLSSTPAFAWDVNEFEDAKDFNIGDGFCRAWVNAQVKCTLRAAIAESRANGSTTDLIELDAGTYEIDPGLGGPGDNMNQQGDFDIGCIAADDVTIRGQGAGVTIIDGVDDDRVFHILSCPGGIRVAFEDLTIQNGNVASDGGGIHMVSGGPDPSRLEITNAHVISNEATGDGGGVYLNLGGDEPVPTTAVFVDALVDENLAGARGGGVAALFTDVSSETTTFTHNDAGDQGGGIFLLESPTLMVDSLVGDSTSPESGNTAQFGGGLAAQVSTVEVFGGEFFDNIAVDDGGGIHLDGCVTTLTEVEILANESTSGNGGGLATIDDPDLPIGVTTIAGSESSSFVSDNLAAINGGGLWTEGGPLNVEDTIVTGNTATGGGGGLACEGEAELVMVSSKATLNTAGGGGGAFLLDCHGDLFNVTLAQNTALDDGGGIYVGGADGLVTIDTTTANSNSAERHGGGLFVGYTSGFLINSTLSGNTAAGHGGGVFFLHDDNPLTDWVSNHATVALNEADTRCGGVHADEFDGVFFNSVIGDNDAPDGPDCGFNIDLWYSLLSDSTDCTVSDPTSTSLINVATGLDSLAINCCGPETHALLSSSLAIGLASPASAETYDETAWERDDGYPDAGSYEYRAP